MELIKPGKSLVKFSVDEIKKIMSESYVRAKNELPNKNSFK